jgi:hypothetical protein
MAFRNIALLLDYSLNMTGHGHMPKRRARHNKLKKLSLFMVPLLVAVIITGYSITNTYKSV